MIAYRSHRPAQQFLYGRLAAEPRHFDRSQRTACFAFLIAAAYATGVHQGVLTSAPEAWGTVLSAVGALLLVRWLLGAWVLYATRNEMPLPSDNRRLSVCIGLRTALLLTLLGMYLCGGALLNFFVTLVGVAFGFGFLRCAYLYGFRGRDLRRPTIWEIAQVVFSLAGLAACIAAVWAVPRHAPWLTAALMLAAQGLDCLCHAAPQDNQDICECAER